MSSHYAKPENALRRAKDLLAINKDSSAFKTLQLVMNAKRSNRTWTETHEKIMLLYLELAVKLRKNAKDALVQYRQICQQQQYSSFEKILRSYAEIAEKQVNDVQQQIGGAEGQGLPAELEDLEESTPEDVMLAAWSGAKSKERQERQTIVPWVRYLWEAYRTVLDVLRNNGRLEVLYHDICRVAFDFCRRFRRPFEFRRLCDLLRHHLQTITKFQGQVNGVALSNQETQRRYLETRFAQLNVAAELELWQEAYRTIEDIHDNMKHSLAEPKPELMRIYYDKLASIFWESENYLFHAYSMQKYFDLFANSAASLPAASDGSTVFTLQDAASSLLLASLVVPTSEHDASHEAEVLASENKGNAHLAALLGFRRETPTRARLITMILNQRGNSALVESHDYVKRSFQLLEQQHSPLVLYSQLAPLFEKIQANPHLQRYVSALQQLTVVRVLQQLSAVYKSMRLEKFYCLVPPLPNHRVEHLLMTAVQNGQVHVRIDHIKGLLTFAEESLESTSMRDQLQVLARALSSIARRLQPVDEVTKAQERARVFACINEGIEPEHMAVFSRQQEIEKRKQEAERTQLEKEKRDAELKAKRAAERKIEEQRRLMEEATKREQERKHQEDREHEFAVKQRLAEELKRRVEAAAAKTNISISAVKKIDRLTENLEAVDVETLRKTEEEVLEQEKREMERRRRDALKRADYIVRAIRIEEKNLIADAEQKRKEQEKELLEEEFRKFVEQERQRHQRDLEEKHRFASMTEQKNIFEKMVLQRRQEEYEAREEHAFEIARRNAIIRVKAERKAAQDQIQRLEEEKRYRLEQERLREEEERQREERRILEEERLKDERIRMEEKERELALELEAKKQRLEQRRLEQERLIAEARVKQEKEDAAAERQRALLLGLAETNVERPVQNTRFHRVESDLERPVIGGVNAHPLPSSRTFDSLGARRQSKPVSARFGALVNNTQTRDDRKDRHDS